VLTGFGELTRADDGVDRFKVEDYGWITRTSVRWLALNDASHRSCPRPQTDLGVRIARVFDEAHGRDSSSGSSFWGERVLLYCSNRSFAVQPAKKAAKISIPRLRSRAAQSTRTMVARRPKSRHPELARRFKGLLPRSRCWTNSAEYVTRCFVFGGQTEHRVVCVA
jgi:hypothetical protein